MEVHPARPCEKAKKNCGKAVALGERVQHGEGGVMTMKSLSLQ